MTPRSALQWLLVPALYALSMPVLLGSVERLSHVAAQTPFTDWINLRYTANPWITVLHLVPGVVMLLVGPLQFSARIRRRPGVHRLLGRIFVGTGILSGLGVLWMVVAFPAVGGLLTQAVTFVLVGAMFGCMGLAIRAIRRGEIALHWAFMARAYGIALSVSTARIFIELGDALFGLSFEDTFVVASALGVAINVLVVESTLRAATALPRERM